MSQSLYSPVLVAVVLVVGCVEPSASPLVNSSDGKSSNAETSAASEQAASNLAAGPPTQTTFVLATGTVYYAGDPQHGHKPDGTFRRGTKVSLVHRAGNYSVVRSEDGIEGYVATHTLEPLAMQ